jgi:L-cysteine S-thiosulfotransferase
MKQLVLVAALSLISLQVFAQQPAIPKADPALVARAVQRLWSKASPEWAAQMVQDETQKICSATRNEPSDADFKAILAREKVNVILPADGNVMGDWKKGEQVAQRGTGGQFSDTPGTYQGGNCYACHQMAKSELSYGTLGPSLLNYGKDRKFAAEDAKMTYAKIYNAQSVLPCSQMPRFGHAQFLTEEQIKDAVAFLFDKDSPVNK